MKVLAASLVGVWLFQVLTGGVGGDRFGVLRWLTLKPSAVTERLQLWRPFTYALLGEPSDVVAIVLDVVVLLIFGSALEERLGRARALGAMYGAGLFGALAVLAASRVDLSLHHVPVVGPSAAMSAIVVAWGMQRATQRMSFFGAFDLSGRQFALAAAALTLVSALMNRTGSHVAAVAGLVAGLFIARIAPPGAKRTTRRPPSSHLRVVPRDPRLDIN